MTLTSMANACYVASLQPSGLDAISARVVNRDARDGDVDAVPKVQPWEKQVLSAGRLKRVGRHSEYAV